MTDEYAQRILELSRQKGLYPIEISERRVAFTSTPLGPAADTMGEIIGGRSSVEIVVSSRDPRSIIAFLEGLRDDPR